jgi:DNA-binding LacI/PurR family transcriptional regulator
MTIREVAKRAGVSLQTVSNVINGRTSQMGEETRERVLRSIAELGYQPNVNARGLRSQRTSTVAYLTVDPSARFLADPFHTALISGMADVLRERDYCLLVQALHPGHPGEAFERLVRQRRFDGAVVHLSGTQAERQRCMEQMSASGCPYVLIEEHVHGPSAACILAGNRQGAESAVEYLRAKGHKRIGFLTTDRPWPAFEERGAGYKAALKAHRLPGPRELSAASENAEVARELMESALRQQPALTAVLCANDVLALGALQAARRLGRRVPDELAIVGFDDFPFARHVEPPLTTVALPGYEMGHRGAELLLAHVQDGCFPETEVVFPTTLISRGSA